MRKFKKLSLIVIIALFAFFSISYIRTVNAETSYQTSSELTIDGAAVRITGKPGIQFVANVNNYDVKDVKLYGMLLAFGRYQATEEFVIDATLGGSKVLKGYKTELRSDNTYRVTVYNFPEDLYLSGMSARPYVELNDGTIVYGESVVYRSLGAVVLKAINSGQSKEGNLLEEVESLITSAESGKGYMKYGIDSFGNFTISNLYEADPIGLRDIFFTDYNNFLTSIGETDTIWDDSEWLEFYYATAPRQLDENGDVVVGAKNTDISTSNLFKFFQQPKMADKWSWILDWFAAKDKDSGGIHISRQVKAIYEGTGTYVDNENHSNFVDDNCLMNLIHLLSSLYSFLYNDPKDYNGAGSLIFGTEESYEKILEYNEKIYADLSKYEVVKIGDTIKLPDVSVDTEINTGYNDGEFEVNQEIVVDSVGASFTPVYQDAFSIQFLDENNSSLGSLVYDGRTDVVFDDYYKEGYVFGGWYESLDFTGEPVKGLPAGTKEDKIYYAKFYEGTKLIVSPMYSANSLGDVITVRGVDYVYGSTAFATILDAVNKANTLTSGITLIELASGNYTGIGNVLIKASNIKIVGPNVDINANSARNEEAVLQNATFWIDPNLKNIEFNGLKFTGSSKIFSRVISNNATYGTNAYGACVTGFKFVNNYASVVTTGWTSGTSGLIEFDHASGYYSYDIEITNNYFEHDLANIASVNYEIEMIALDNVCNVNISNNTFKNIKDIAIHTYDKNRGLSGETNRINNNIFENIQGDAIRINHFAPGNTGSNNIVEFNDNTFTDVTGICISLGYLSGSTYYIGNASDIYKEISISGNTFNTASENYIYCYKWYNSWTNTVINDNVFNAIPSGYYIYVNYRTDALYPENTEYYNNGEELNINAVDSSKFTSNVKYAQEYTITYMYNGQVISGLADTYYESLETYTLASSYDITNGVFEGWYDNPEFTGSPITQIAAGDKGDKVYYAKITVYYTIKYMYNGAEVTGLTPTKYKQGEAFELPSYVVGDPTRYVFEGWYTNSNLTSGAIDAVDSSMSGNLVLYAKVTIVKKGYAVDDDWASKANGATVTLNGKSYIYGTDAFSTIVDAITAVNALGATANVNIDVAAGTYQGSFDITTSGVKFSGPNEGIDGSSARNAEAIINNSYIRLGKQVKDIEINGFKLVGTSRLYKSDKSISGGTASSFTTDVDGFKFVNNYVDTANTNGFAQFIDSSYSYSKNIVFSNNYFTQSVTTTYYLWLNNCYNVVITDNIFKNITGTAVYIDGGTVGLIGEHTEICNNTFDTVAADAIFIKNIDPICDSGNPAIDFNDNIFRSVTGTCIKFNQIKGNANFGSKSYSYISVANNIFDNSFANGIYVTTHSEKMNLMISGNIFNVIPSGYYIYLKSTVTVYALGNDYLDGGIEISNVNSSKFTSNIVYEPQPIEITSMGSTNGVVKVGETVQYMANYAGGTWTSSDESVAIIDQTGRITGVSAGSAVITIEFEGSSFSSGVTVYDDSYSSLMQLILQNNTGILLNQDVTYYGFLEGYEYMLHNIYDSANNYWPGTITIDSTTYMRKNHSGYAMTPKYVVVHDTASTTHTAKQTASICKGNTSSSWHYSSGSDGVYQSVSDTVSAGHAGDGSRAMGFTKTKVKGTPGSTVQLPVTVSGGYYYLGGQNTGVAVPSTATTKLPATGIYHYVGSDGYYYLADTYYNSTYKTLSMKGGNRHSIGIETSVKYSTDVYLTWQVTAKLVAQLLVKWNLNTKQVMQHNNFSGKDCPMTMRHAGMWDDFMEIVEVEYAVLKNYSGWKIEFDSSNESYLYNNGRVQNRPEKTVATSYTVKITSPAGKVETAKLHVIIPGHTNNVLSLHGK